MADLYWKYAREREGSEVLEHEWGFAMFKPVGDDVLYLHDIFVLPEYRMQDKATTLLNEVTEYAKAKGYKKLIGSCSPSANGSTGSLKSMLARGFRLHASEQNMIYLVKEL